jgi:molybdopterin molybdotransferase
MTDSIRAASCADDYDPESMSLAKAKAFIHQFLTPLTGRVRVPLRSALGRVLAEAIVAPHNVPSHRNSAMDGWALAATDLAPDGSATLTEVGSVFAGQPYSGAIRPGECVRIFTGGVVPDALDTVVMQERARREEDGRVQVFAGVRAGQNVRAVGEDLARGSVALPSGRLLQPADLGLLASLGIGELTCYRRLRVAFFSTGDELVGIDQPLGVGQVYDSNRYTIQAMLERLGCDVMDGGVVRDDPHALRAAFAQAAANADVVITSGGVSVGEADFVKQLLSELGEVVFWKVAMKPGRPLAYGRIGGAHFFGLPGNPVSVMATFQQVVRGALLYLQGCAPVPEIPLFRVECTSPIKKAPGRMDFQRGVLYSTPTGWKVRSTGAQGSGILKSMSEANCFIVLSEEMGDLQAGSVVDVQSFTSFH